MPQQIVNEIPIHWEEGKPEHLAIPFRAEGVIHLQVPMSVPEPWEPGGERSAPRYVALFGVFVVVPGERGSVRPLFCVEANTRKRSLRLSTGSAAPGVGAPQRALDGKGSRLVEVFYEQGQVALWLDGKPVAEMATNWMPEPGQPLSLVLGRQGGEAAAPHGFTFHGLGLGIGQQIGEEQAEPEHEPVAEEPVAPPPPAAPPVLALQGLVHLYGIALPAVVGYYGDMGAPLVENEHDIAEQAAKLAEAAYAKFLERQRSGAWSPEKWRGL